MKIEIKKTTTEEIVIGIPSFYKHKEFGFYYAVLAENDAVCVHISIDGSCDIKQEYSVYNVFDGSQEISTKEIFLAAYKKAIDTINKQYVEVIDDIAMLTENDNTEDPAQDELEWEKHQQTQTL